MWLRLLPCMQRQYCVCLRCTSMRRRAVCAMCACSAIVRTYLPGGYDRTTLPSAPAHTSGVRTPSAALLCTPPSCVHAPCAMRDRSLREDHNHRASVVLLAMCEIVPCVCKRCAYLRPAFGCAVLVQVFAGACPRTPRRRARGSRRRRSHRLVANDNCVVRARPLPMPAHVALRSTATFVVLVASSPTASTRAHCAALSPACTRRPAPLHAACILIGVIKVI